MALIHLALLFLRLGLTAFGGPAAHIALMKQEVVDRRRWMTEQEFLDLLGATQLIPGPNSTELAIHIGLRRGGFAGLVLAGLCFILPAALIVSACAQVYTRYGQLPSLQGAMSVVKPVVVVVVLQAVLSLGRKALRNRFLWAVGLLWLGLYLGGCDELLLLIGAGACSGLRQWWQVRGSGRSLGGLAAVTLMFLATPYLLARLAPFEGRPEFGQWPLFLFFLKVGSVLYGSGYVLLAFLQDTLVGQWGWLSGQQLLDAIAIGQVTPGPVLTTATFIGFVLGGPQGATVATIGIFLPAFVLVAISGPLVARLRTSALAGAFLDGVNVASLALMLGVTLHLGSVVLRTPLAAGVAAAAAVLLLRFRLNSACLILAAAALGLLVSHR